MSRYILVIVLVVILAATSSSQRSGRRPQRQRSLHGWSRGYSGRTSRTWSNSIRRRGKATPFRGGRQGDINGNGLDANLGISPLPECTSPCNPGSKVRVCGTDGKTYNNRCQLQEQACKQVRRQGRSFEKKILQLRVAHEGKCKAECDGMEGLGMFKAFGSKATNSGACIHDFFRCASTVRGKSGMGATEVQKCCQLRFDKCNRG